MSSSSSSDLKTFPCDCPIPVYFDLEATGLHVNHDQIIEWHFTVDPDWAAQHGIPDVAASHGSRIRPDVPMDPGAQRVHCISSEDLQHEPSFTQAVDSLNGFIVELTRICKNKSVLLIAHNAFGFDSQMLDHELHRANKLLSATIVYADTYRYILLHPAFFRQKLGMAAQYRRVFGEEMPNAHTARGDVDALIKLVKTNYAKDNHEQFYNALLQASKKQLIEIVST
jgi:DNA polymerase III alpha subunit (gram-positive type)